MAIAERRAYTRTTLRCDACGFEENVVRVDEEPMDSRHQLPPLRGWMVVPVRSFTRDEQHACSRGCAERIAKAALDEANPRCTCDYSRGTSQGRCVECGRPA